MNTEIKLPIAMSDFKAVIESGCVFVDKSLLIRDLIREDAEVISFFRPRGFGKSVNLSMLKYFFSCAEPSSLDLFEGLNIQAAGEEYLKHQGQYPVISLSFKDIVQDNCQAAYEAIAHLISDTVAAHAYLLDSEQLDSDAKERIRRLLERRADASELHSSLKTLSRCVYQHYGQRAIILIDDYDSPLHTAYLHGYVSEMLECMRGLLDSGLKDNPSIAKAVVMGVLWISMGNLFSGLDWAVYSSLDEGYSNYFGFTEQEVNHLFAQVDAQHRPELVRSWCGRHSVGSIECYHPVFIFNWIEHKGPAELCWVNTNSDELVNRLLVEQGYPDVQRDLAQWMSEEAVEECLESPLNIQNIAGDRVRILTVLWMSGYLDAVPHQMLLERCLYALRIPNRQVRCLYHRRMAAWLSGAQGKRWLLDCMDDLRQVRMDVFRDKLKTICLIHGLIFVTIFQSQTDYDIEAHREACAGLYDIALIPKTPHRELPALLFKINQVAVSDLSELVPAAQTALAQVEKTRYAKELSEANIQHCVRVGIAFAGQHLELAYEEGAPPRYDEACRAL